MGRPHLRDERFIHPLQIFDRQSGKVSVAFRKRTHLIPCTTRRMKTLRKQVLRLFPQYVLAMNPKYYRIVDKVGEWPEGIEVRK